MYGMLLWEMRSAVWLILINMMLSSFVMGEQFVILSSVLVTERHAHKYFHNLVSSNLTKIVQ